MFGADMCASVYIDNTKKDILILELEDTTLTANTSYSIYFSKQQNRLSLSLLSLFVNGEKIHQFKTKNLDTGISSSRSSVLKGPIKVVSDWVFSDSWVSRVSSEFTFGGP